MQRLMIGLVTVLSALGPVGAQSANGFTGTWEGAIVLPNGELGIIVTLESDPWQGSIDIPQQGLNNQALINITSEGNAIRFGIEETLGIEGAPTFDGQLVDGSLEGDFSQSGQTFPFYLNPQTAMSKSAETQVLELGRELTQQLYTEDFEALTERYSEAMLEELDVQAMTALWEQLKNQIGTETRLLGERVSNELGFNVYRRVALFGEGTQARLEWVFNDDGVVEGFSIRPDRSSEAPSDYLTYETKTPLRLPFEGEWFVFWGGRTVEENYHAAYPGQRFAYDFLVMRDGQSFSGEGETLEDYYCYGEAILAPGDGVLVRVVSDLPDQPIGSSDPENAAGNHVVIDHGNGEFSLLAHLQQNSLTVSEGATVSAGDTLGRCGNSGNSSEPHLHYHLQSTPDVYAPSEGLPAQFLAYTADGVAVQRGEPRRGEAVRP